MWLWVASDVKTRLVPVQQMGRRNPEMAYAVMHELKERLAACNVLPFSMDGLKRYTSTHSQHTLAWGARGGE
jgi:hypothetical protein